MEQLRQHNASQLSVRRSENIEGKKTSSELTFAIYSAGDLGIVGSG